MNFKISQLAVIALTASVAQPVLAAQVSVSLDELQEFRLQSSSPLDKAIAKKLSISLSDSVKLVGNTLLVDEVLEAQVLDDSCDGSKLHHAALRVTLPPQSEIGFEYSSVLQPISVSIDTRAQIEASGSAVQYFGIGNRENCVRLGSDNFDFTLDGELDIGLQVTLDPQAQLQDETNLQLSPVVAVTLEIGQQRFSVGVGSTIFKSLLKNRLQDALTESLAPDSIFESAERASETMQQKVIETLEGDRLTVELPAVNSQLTATLREWIGDTAGFPLSESYLADNSRAIVNAALLGDTETLEQLLGSLLACQVGSVLLSDMEAEPLFAQNGDACEASTSLNQVLFSDAACQQAINVRRQPLNEYCALVTGSTVLGDGSASAPQVNEWQLSPGTRLGITLPVFDDSIRQPYQGSVNFQQTTSDRGTCSLEMRVYTPNPGKKNLRPVIAFHGGSWSQRGAGFVGMESLLAHLTSRDMLVFVPFYRLAGDQDGPTACRQFVAEDLVADAAAALDWVKLNGKDYGARDGKVGLFGQSAGGFLATWLAVNRSDDIDAALLMYAPTDVGSFVDDFDSGVYTNERGVGILERLLGVEQAQWSDDPSRIAALSMAQQINDGAAAPAMHLIHGLADDLVLPNQSERLCDALNGGTAETSSTLRLQRRACGENGQLDLIEGAEHALEVCAPGIECKAGDLISATATQNSLREAYDWLANDKPEEENTTDTTTDPNPADAEGTGSEGTGDDAPQQQSSSGGGAMFFLLLLLPLLALRLFSRAGLVRLF